MRWFLGKAGRVVGWSLFAIAILGQVLNAAWKTHQGEGAVAYKSAMGLWIPYSSIVVLAFAAVFFYLVAIVWRWHNLKYGGYESISRSD